MTLEHSFVTIPTPYYLRKKVTKNMFISATEAVRIQCAERCSFTDRDLEEPCVATICIVRHQLGWSKLVTESSFSKLNKMARVTKTIHQKCKAKESAYDVT